MWFFGEHAITLDGKGRLALPTRFRGVIAEVSDNQLVLTYNPYESHSLFLYPRFKWEEVRDQVMALGTAHPDHRWMQRLLVGSATPVEPDKQGRFLLPQQLREVAELDKRVVLMGMGERFEIWNEQVLNTSRREQMQRQAERMQQEESLGQGPSEQLQQLSL